MRALWIGLAVFVIAAPSQAGLLDFSELDTNLDGYISRAEAGRSLRLSKVFEEADLNGDGKLDWEEFELAIELIRQYERHWH